MVVNGFGLAWLISRLMGGGTMPQKMGKENHDNGVKYNFIVVIHHSTKFVCQETEILNLVKFYYYFFFHRNLTSVFDL